MISISIDEELRSTLPKVSLGTLTADVNIRQSDAILLEKIDGTTRHIKEFVPINEIGNIKALSDSTQAYKILGIDPNRYRISSEALLRRIIKGKDLYRVNNVVDINNLISISSGYSVGSYDFEKIDTEVVYKIGEKSEIYKAIGKEEISVECFPVLCDKTGVFGTSFSDSERTMITEKTKKVFMVIYDFSSTTDLEMLLDNAGQLLEEFANGNVIHKQII